jgi:hypothetical protein
MSLHVAPGALPCSSAARAAQLAPRSCRRARAPGALATPRAPHARFMLHTACAGRALTRAARACATHTGAARRDGALRCRASAAAAGGVDRTINPRVASLNESKTMALTDLARAMKEAGKPVRPRGRCARGGGR